MMDGWLLAAEALDLMHWHLLRPAPGGEFIQNDQGVARLDRSMRFFPLTPDACLLVCEGSRARPSWERAWQHGSCHDR